MRTPGQVAYEAMRRQCIRRDIFREREVPADADEKLREAYEYLNGQWDAQPDAVKEDWEVVGNEIWQAALAGILT